MVFGFERLHSFDGVPVVGWPPAGPLSKAAQRLNAEYYTNVGYPLGYGEIPNTGWRWLSEMGNLPDEAGKLGMFIPWNDWPFNEPRQRCVFNFFRLKRDWGLVCAWEFRWTPVDEANHPPLNTCLVLDVWDGSDVSYPAVGEAANLLDNIRGVWGETGLQGGEFTRDGHRLIVLMMPKGNKHRKMFWRTICETLGDQWR